MQNRLSGWLTDRADVERRVETGTNDIGEPIYDRELVEGDVPCAFDPGGTEFVRADTGERTETPATVTFLPIVDVEEGDRITVDGQSTVWEARSVNRARDHLHGGDLSITVTLERRD